ncbi:unnamed protein product [Calypogeia fissa]
MAARGALVLRHGGRLSKLYSTSASPSSTAPSSSSTTSGVEVQDFLRAIGKGVEAHAEKMAKEAGSLPNLLRFRGGSLKGLGIPCQQRKLILRYIEKYRQGTWKPSTS